MEVLNQENVKTINKIVAALTIVFVLAGCAGMSTTQQRTLSGGAIGAGAGALIGGVAGGSPGVGRLSAPAPAPEHWEDTSMIGP